MTLQVIKAQGLVTVQDLGRRGRMHEAVPPGGALVPERLIAANRRAGNPDDACALEVLGRLVVQARVATEVATDAEKRALAAGEELAVTSEPRRVAYLAVRGGVLGEPALVCAGMGTIVRAAMDLASAGAPRSVRETFEVDDSVQPIRVIKGPDAVSQTLVTGSYRVLPASDRVGTRLDGERIEVAGQGISRPMVVGAIEVPPDGQPIVLGPEHPTTGGYPLIGVVATPDLGRLFSIRLGGSVRFQYV